MNRATDAGRRVRNAAVGLGVLGVALGGGGVAYPGAQTVLFALGGTALVSALLVYTVSPADLLSSRVAQQVFSPIAANQQALVAELALDDRRLYVPREDGADPPVWLYVPPGAETGVPSSAEMESLFVDGMEAGARGMALAPTASDLLVEVESAGPTGLESRPDRLVVQLCTALRRTYGLVDAVRTSTDAAAGEAVIEVSGAAFGDVTQFDHPVPSLLAGGLAWGLDRPVSVDVAAASTDLDGRIVCRWEH